MASKNMRGVAPTVAPIIASQCAMTNCTDLASLDNRVDTPLLLYSGGLVTLYFCDDCYAGPVRTWLASLATAVVDVTVTTVE